MKVIKFLMSHGCWANQITEKYPDLTLKGDPVVVVDEGHLAHVVAEGTDPAKVIDFLNKRKDLTNIRVIKKSKDYAQLLLTITDKDSVTNLIRQYGCSARDTCYIGNGLETWKVLCLDNGSAFLSKLRELGEVKVLSIKSIEPTDAIPSKTNKETSNLTERQLQLLRAAVKGGYYNWPRETNIKKLSSKLNIERSVLQEHIRKAESKVIRNLLTK